MKNNVEEDRNGIELEERFQEDEMSRAGDGEEFGYSLHRSEDYCFNKRHESLLHKIGKKDFNDLFRFEILVKIPVMHRRHKDLSAMIPGFPKGDRLDKQIS